MQQLTCFACQSSPGILKLLDGNTLCDACKTRILCGSTVRPSALAIQLHATRVQQHQAALAQSKQQTPLHHFWLWLRHLVGAEIALFRPVSEPPSGTLWALPEHHSQYDLRLQHALYHWPQQPASHWQALSEFVGQRDVGRCQIAGCPSIESLQCHHIIPRSKGGNHHPSNLITLCAIHHALQPRHAGLLASINSPRFTWRQGASGWKISRNHLADKYDTQQLAEKFSWRCPPCKSAQLFFEAIGTTVSVRCSQCQWIGSTTRGMPEECGPKLDELLAAEPRAPHQRIADWSGLSIALATKPKPSMTYKSKSLWRVYGHMTKRRR